MGVNSVGGDMGMGQANLMQQVSTSVLRMSMDRVKETGDAVVKMMEQSVDPDLGQNIDIKC